MEVGENQMLRPQQRDLRRLRFLYFYNELGDFEYGFRVDHDFRSGGFILRVRVARAFASAGLHDHAVAALHEFRSGARHHADAVLLGLNLTRDADVHDLATLGRNAEIATSKPPP